jgi:elongation factor G
VLSQVFEPATCATCRSPLGFGSLGPGGPVAQAAKEKETGRFEVAGQGELHLEILAERLKREFGLMVRRGNPKVQLKERLLKGARVLENFDRDLGGERVRVSVEVSVRSKRNRPGVELLQNPG